MKILILDNYDSFTYNLVQYFKELTDAEIVVKRNDDVSVEELSGYDTLVFSPGPGLPKDAGIMIDVIKKYAGEKKMLGVCLGHQAIGEAFGAKLTNLEKVYHGVKSDIEILDPDDKIFKNIDKNTGVGRYHSWVIDPDTLSDEFKVTSVSTDNNIMSIKHKEFKIWGVQFHPESIMTDQGKKMIENFLKA
ncbi:MAG TPA: aminodeoxychorismate/anthranilate synthase component II [Bacteroidetes bacterium]|nr:aminodeoxychorismate/anthranilate synthase component II [Bacteroidota bacterium]